MTTAISTFGERALSVGSLSSYIQWVNQIPLLSEVEEQQLAERLRYQGDLEAARLLVMAHLRFVVRVAKGYLGYGLPEADLIQEGNIGLMKAVKRVDPSVGVRLVTFAVHWIRAEIHEFIIRNWRIVKIATTKAQRKLFFNLRKQSKQHNWLSEAEVDAVAKELAVSHKDVRHMEARLSQVDETFEMPDDADEDTPLSPSHYLEDLRFAPETALAREEWDRTQSRHLADALNRLDERSRLIVQRRWLDDDKATLHDLADELSVSAERVRQLEKTAMNKLRVSLQGV